MTPYKSKKTFKTRLVIAISIVNLAVILAITYLTYRWNAQQLQEQTIAQTQQTIEQAGTNVSTYMDELYRLTLTPYRLQTGKEHNHIVAAHLPYTHDDQCRLAPRCIPQPHGYVIQSDCHQEVVDQTHIRVEDPQPNHTDRNR